MSKRVLLAAGMLLFVPAGAFADVGFFRSDGSPDFEKSSIGANAFFGLSLAAMLSFGGYWGIRNPSAGLALFLLIIGIGFLLIGLVFLPLVGPLVPFELGDFPVASP